MLFCHFSLQLNGPEYWRFYGRKYTEIYQQNHLLCDVKFRPSVSKTVIKDEEEDNESDIINQETLKSYFGNSNLF